MRRGSGHADSGHFLHWLDKAEEDLRAAYALMRHGEDVNNAAAFHCHQCIEKALKAYLIKRLRRQFDGHNLTFLCKMAQRADPRFVDWLDESAALNRLYIEARYPADLPFDIDDARLSKLYKMAEDMFAFIDAEINAHKDVAAAAESAGSPRFGGTL